MKALQSTWIAAAIGAVLFFATSFLLIKPEKLAPPKDPAIPTETPNLPPKNPWDYVNPEVDGLLAELTKEREALKIREQQLNELALRLESERAEINQVTQAVHQIQIEFDSIILKVKEDETANLKKLAKLYSSMSPDGAALVLKELTIDQTAKILAFMKEAESAPILETLAKTGDEEPKRVAMITERLRVSTQSNKPPPSAKP